MKAILCVLRRTSSCAPGYCLRRVDRSAPWLESEGSMPISRIAEAPGLKERQRGRFFVPGEEEERRRNACL